MKSQVSSVNVYLVFDILNHIRCCVFIACEYTLVTVMYHSVIVIIYIYMWVQIAIISSSNVFRLYLVLYLISEHSI